MDTLEIIRQLQTDSALRAQLRAVLLGEEVLSLPELVKENSRQIAALTEAIKEHDVKVVRVESRLGNLNGKFTEESYRRNFGTRVRNVEEGKLRINTVIDGATLDKVLDDAVDNGLISSEEAEDLAVVDVVAEGRIRSTGEVVTVVAEVASTVHIDDVIRAIKRSEIAGRATKRRGIPVVMGEKAEVINDSSYPGVWLIEGNKTRELLGRIG